MSECPKCGATLPTPAATGRPRRYCSTACRRLGEIERRRLTRILDALEDRRIADQFSTGCDFADLQGRDRAQRLADILTAILSVENRLRALLFDE